MNFEIHDYVGHKLLNKYLILTKSTLRKKMGQKKLGHPATACIQAGTRCTIPEIFSHFERVQTQKKNRPKKKWGIPQLLLFKQTRDA